MSPPRKERRLCGAALKTAEPLKVYPANKCAQGCKHANTRIDRTADDHIHHGREVCADCGVFLRWSPKPTTLQRQKINELKLKRLEAASLDGWAQKFVTDMQGKRKWSPQQQLWIDRLYDQHVEDML